MYLHKTTCYVVCVFLAFMKEVLLSGYRLLGMFAIEFSSTITNSAFIAKAVLLMQAMIHFKIK